MLTIKQLAGFVGVTVRAVRHYHAYGLLPEPPRDGSGYRRYDAQAVAQLARIRTLVEAGVPLSRIQTLLCAGPEEFTQAVEEIDRSLHSEIERLQRARERIARLSSGDRLVLPAAVVDHLDQLRALGVSDRGVSMEREGWVVVAARAPDRAAEWAAAKQRQLEDPRFRAFYLAFDHAFDLPPDDPRLEQLADDLCAYLTSVESEIGGDEEDDVSEHLAPLLDNWVIPASPAWQRLQRLLEQRGWTGWTQIQRSQTPAR